MDTDSIPQEGHSRSQAHDSIPNILPLLSANPAANRNQDGFPSQAANLSTTSAPQPCPPATVDNQPSSPPTSINRARWYAPMAASYKAEDSALLNNIRSTSPDEKLDPDGAGGKTTHRRNYQACEPCRARKVRCELGGMYARQQTSTMR